MRYYLFRVQYNKDKEAENRESIKAFNTLDNATAEFHSALASDMKNETLGWSLCMIINSDGVVERSEKWTRIE